MEDLKLYVDEIQYYIPEETDTIEYRFDFPFTQAGYGIRIKEDPDEN